MSVQSSISTFTYSVEDKISVALRTGKNTILNAVGTLTTKAGSLFNGGFVGMSDSGFESLKNAIKKYCEDLQTTINGYNSDADITGALKGDTQVAAQEFIEAIKGLLDAYISTIKQEIDEAQEAYENFKSSSASIKSNVVSDAEQIRSDAKSISLD